MSKNIQDDSRIELREWIESFDQVVTESGHQRASFILREIINKMKKDQIKGNESFNIRENRFINTIHVEKEKSYPGNLEIEKKIEAFIRWNSALMVAKANERDSSLGGHIGSGAYITTLYEVGFNHFFKAKNNESLGDLIFYQGHTSPVIYARSYLEGNFTKEHLYNFRQQSTKKESLSSYPHPYLQPNYWQFPTVSMGLGPIQAIYQAKFIKYLESRKLLLRDQNRHVWAFCGDGEMDEPESLGAITRASREGLDNLIFVVNCNLQRLDGLVHGNGKIVTELANVFTGAGWNVIKVLWGGSWDKIFRLDTNGKLQKRLSKINDGQMQFARARGTVALRETIFGNDPELEELGKKFSDDDVVHLTRGGHDHIKIYNAYDKAVNYNNGKPTLILPMTVKGFGLGEWGESQNIAHNVKKLNSDAFKYISKRFNLPIGKEELTEMDFIKLKRDSKEEKYLHRQRERLGGYIPHRDGGCNILKIPHYTDFGKLFLERSVRKFSTTTAFVRMLVALTRDKNISKNIVPITVDESRTFGMEGLFRQLGIYNIHGQQYTSEDNSKIMYYKESKDGQIIQDGINEAGGFCSWLSAATSYSIHNITMIPFYIFYSMFGFQRIGDLIWSAGDSRARGFLMGGTSGRTTLNGEGLQHQDGHSHIQAGLIPSCISYDPSYAYELAIIIWHGMNEMYIKNRDIFFYITLTNENYTHEKMPENCEHNIIKGLHCIKKSKYKEKNQHVHLIGSGSILNEVIEASVLIEKDFGVISDVWSMTSANELYRNSKEISRKRRLNYDKNCENSHIEECFSDCKSPIVAATDYVKLYLEQLREFMPNYYVTLGTDGYGRSDSRERLRSFFEVDRFHIAYSAIYTLWRKNSIDECNLLQAKKIYSINCNKLNPEFH